LKRFVIVLALLATSCSGGSGVAATVNGVDVDVATVEGLLDTGDEELTEVQFRAVLTGLVQWEAIVDAARTEFGIDPSDEEVSAYADELFAAQGAGVTREEFLEAQEVTEAGFLLSANRLLVEEQVLEELEATIEVPTTEEAEQMLTDDPKSWTLVCAAHILVATEEEATAVLARLDGGDEFADLAIELSLDTGSGSAGGDLGCSAPARWVTAFADATLATEIGSVTDPVETEFGFHLIRVDSRVEATPEEIQQTLLETQMATLAQSWFLDAVVSAEITIAEEYGTWTTDPAPTIVAP
jgi:foldase protein PrsA